MENCAMNAVPLGKAAAWPAPAKLNLCLHIVGRRTDGYHLLQSAIQFIDLSDQLRFYRRPPGCIERLAGPADVPPEADLVVRAARLLAATGGSSFGAAIELHKQIPLQAGLGGGSSDAATALVALNTLWRVGLSVDQLAELGLKVGADVPVFVRGQAAWMEGIGEVLTPADFATPTYLVIKPPVAVSTAEIFHASELTRNTPVTTIRAFREQGGRNDCAPTVRARYPKVAEALDWLGKFGKSQLTGTGACIFAALPDARTAKEVRAQMPADWQGFVVQGLNSSPLLARLEAEDEIGEG
jgi:4-diphosphocytidyl-2-C-methyl-D-erythritol kinase